MTARQSLDVGPLVAGLIRQATASAAGDLTTDFYRDLSTTSAQTLTTPLTSTDRVEADIGMEPSDAVQLKLAHSTAAQGVQVNRIALGVSPVNEERLA